MLSFKMLMYLVVEYAVKKSNKLCYKLKIHSPLWQASML